MANTGNEAAVARYHKLAHGLAVTLGLPAAYFLGVSHDGDVRLLPLIVGMVAFEILLGLIGFALARRAKGGE